MCKLHNDDGVDSDNRFDIDELNDKGEQLAPYLTQWAAILEKQMTKESCVFTFRRRQ